MRGPGPQPEGEVTVNRPPSGSRMTAWQPLPSVVGVTGVTVPPAATASAVTASMSRTGKWTCQRGRTRGSGAASTAPPRRVATVCVPSAHDHLVVLVGHLAAARLLGGPVEDLRIEDGGGEGIPGAQFQTRRARRPVRPTRPCVWPSQKPKVAPSRVGGEGGASGADLERADGDGRPALADPGRGVVGVLDGEVRGPGHGDLEALREGTDAGDRLPVGDRDGELVAEAGRTEAPAQDSGVELLSGLEIAGHQADPAGGATHGSGGPWADMTSASCAQGPFPLCQRRGGAAPRARPLGRQRSCAGLDQARCWEY